MTGSVRPWQESPGQRAWRVIDIVRGRFRNN
jgi:hypothetical protein